MLCIALLLETIRSLRQERDENVERLRVPRRCRCNPGNGFPVLRCHHQRRQWRFGRERRTPRARRADGGGILAVHNEARRAVGVAPLAWSAASPGTPRGTRRRGAATARRGARRSSTSARTRSSGRAAVERGGAGGGVGGRGPAAVRLRQQHVRRRGGGRVVRVVVAVHAVHAGGVAEHDAGRVRPHCVRLRRLAARLRLLPAGELRHRPTVLIVLYI